MLAEKVSFLVPTILSDAELSVLISVYGRCEQPVARDVLPVQESFLAISDGLKPAAKMPTI